MRGSKAGVSQAPVYIIRTYINEGEKMLTAVHVMYVFFPTRNNRVLACAIDPYTRAHVHKARTTRIHHDHTCTAVVHTRVVVSVGVRPRKA